MTSGSGTLKLFTQAASRQASYRSQRGCGVSMEGQMLRNRLAAHITAKQKQGASGLIIFFPIHALAIPFIARIAPSPLHSIDPAKPTYKHLSPTIFPHLTFRTPKTLYTLQSNKTLQLNYYITSNTFVNNNVRLR